MGSQTPKSKPKVKTVPTPTPAKSTNRFMAEKALAGISVLLDKQINKKLMVTGADKYKDAYKYESEMENIYKLNKNRYGKISEKSPYDSVGKKYYNFLKIAEGIVKYPYLDTADNDEAKNRKNVTLGIGFTFDIKKTGWTVLKKVTGWSNEDIKTIINDVYNGKNLKKSKYTLTKKQVKELYNEGIKSYIVDAKNAITKFNLKKKQLIRYNQNEFDAIVDFAYNNGLKNLKNINDSDLIIYYYLRKDQAGAVKAMKKFGGGNRRRLNQANLFFYGEYNFTEDLEAIRNKLGF